MTTLQKTIVIATLAAAVGTGIYAVHQSSQLRGQLQVLQQAQAPLNAQLQQLEQERDRATGQLAALQDENARLRSGSNTTELLKLRGQVGQLRQQAANKTSPPASGLAKLMSDPAMRDYLRQAQMNKIGSMYADLFKELKLTPEQSDKVLQVLTDYAAQGMSKYMASTQGTPDQPGTTVTQAELGSQLWALLGDAGMARFRDYSDEIPGRTTVTLLNGQLGDTPLSDEQSARLIQIIKAEPNNLTLGITGAPDTAFLGSQSDIDYFLQQVAQSNQRILQQAGSFLTPDQLAVLNNVLTKAIDTRKLQAAALIQKH